MAKSEQGFALEALGYSKPIMDAYDPITDEFHFWGKGPLWSGVERAHQLGLRGEGRKVAIVDAQFTLDLPFLKKRADRIRQTPNQPLDASIEGDHGNAVALLVSRIAPASRFDLYSTIGADGNWSKDLTIQALSEAAESDAHVINLSLGEASLIDADRLLAELRSHPNAPFRSHPNCAMCAAAKSAVAAGKLMFAAAGNLSNYVWCPARAEGVISVGFQTERREVISLPEGLALEIATGEKLGYMPPFFDFTVVEIENVFGTSFACPLYAGVGGLGVTGEELNGYIASNRSSGDAMRMHALLREGKTDPQTVATTGLLYKDALEHLPHVHSKVQAQLRPDIPYSDPSTCWQCGIFAVSTYVNAGLFELECHDVDTAVDLLLVARKVAPWSYDAAANLGRAYEEKGRAYWPEAIALYDTALSMRPNFEPYLRERERIRRLLYP